MRNRKPNEHGEIYSKDAKIFCDAIRKMAANPETIDNFESYLSYHFKVWYDKYANTPEGLISEFKQFSKIGYDEED